MSEYEQIVSMISLTMGVAWASGINLYAALLVLGIGGSTGHIELPEPLLVLQDPMVIVAAGFMYAVEFFADKTPGVDTSWDALHTFVRIPAGAMLAAGSVAEVGPVMQVAAGILGGGLAAATHTAKASTRVLINTSPEPVSNWTASIAEDLAVFAGLWAALNHPVVFLALLLLFILLLVWALPKLWRGARAVLRKLGQWLGLVENPDSSPGADLAGQLERLQKLRDQGVLTQDELDQAKRQILTGATGEPGGIDYPGAANKSDS